MAVPQAGLLELNSAAVPAPAGRAAEKAARGQREKWLRSEIYARWAKKGLEPRNVDRRSLCDTLSSHYDPGSFQGHSVMTGCCGAL